MACWCQNRRTCHVLREYSVRKSALTSPVEQWRLLPRMSTWRNPQWKRMNTINKIIYGNFKFLRHTAAVVEAISFHLFTCLSPIFITVVVHSYCGPSSHPVDQPFFWLKPSCYVTILITCKTMPRWRRNTCVYKSCLHRHSPATCILHGIYSIPQHQ